ncbi:co-chaperone YbbN [Fusibacter sp. 3D3]|uniref:thioredoxin family protein n=1 Tax=Fusibacter sp. 3D3 TaxID=1048380 RepID=UPI000853E306|nr:thioredoxin family protein [Fusibacter sp. 3D3]GAU76003.1 thioredoxin [Fusibacter sp. 3D3]
MNDKQSSRKKEIVIKIGIVMLVIGLVGGVWIYKNKPVTAEDTSLILSQGKTSEHKLPEQTSEEDYFPLEVTEAIDLEKLKTYGVPIIIDFGADSCNPCKEMAPVLKKLNEDLAGKAIILFADVWKYPELATNYPVEVIPTQILIDSAGKPYFPSEEMSIEFIQYTLKDTGEHVFTTHQGGLTEEQMILTLREMGLEE